MGTIFSVPIVRVPLASTLRRLQQGYGITCFGSVVHRSSRDFRVRDSSMDCTKWCLVLGSEAHGMSQDVMAVCKYLVRIPMSDGVDSFSIVTAAAILLSGLCERERPDESPWTASPATLAATALAAALAGWVARSLRVSDK